MNYILSDNDASDSFTVECMNVSEVLGNKTLADEVVRLFTILTDAEIAYHDACGIKINGKYTPECILRALGTKEKVFLLKSSNDKYVGMCWIGSSGFQNVDQLTALVIEPGYRGRGLGSKIINAVVAADPQKSISLTVSVANPHAINLYRSLGFQDTDIKMVRHAN